MADFYELLGVKLLGATQTIGADAACIQDALLLGVPAGSPVLRCERLTTDSSGLFWIRAGATAGLGAVALQSVWETGLVMPANATLAALLAAIAIHDRPRHES